MRGTDIGSFVADARRRVEPGLPLPPGYSIDWGGQFENQARAMRRLLVVVPAAVLIIFELLFATFDSVPQALLILLNVPFALVGGIGALWARGLNLNLSASVGFIALFGVAVLNGIVMVSYMNRLREDGMECRRALLEGARVRLRPVLMTALVASFGFLPMAISTSTGAEVQRPLATVVIGELITSTMLTLFLLPVLYPWFCKGAGAGKRYGARLAATGGAVAAARGAPARRKWPGPSCGTGRRAAGRRGTQARSTVRAAICGSRP